ncbi:MAG TPA: SAM-dependent chlorinase/fluorinase, partial [Vicinamibacteria bacterium]
MRPIVALLSDFGIRDHYAGAMKGAVLSACPEAEVVDLTHEIEPHDVFGAAFALSAAFQAFPPGTVFLAVVDPGVGTERRGLAAGARGHLFVAPDNGLLTLVLADGHGASIHEIANTALLPGRVSSTFHGRDVFAPVAGHLARGGPLAFVGPPTASPVLLPLPEVTPFRPGVWIGTV